jgi:hypothetical protein
VNSDCASPPGVSHLNAPYATLTGHRRASFPSDSFPPPSDAFDDAFSDTRLAETVANDLLADQFVWCKSAGLASMDRTAMGGGDREPSRRSPQAISASRVKPSGGSVSGDALFELYSLLWERDEGRVRSVLKPGVTKLAASNHERLMAVPSRTTVPNVHGRRPQLRVLLSLTRPRNQREAGRRNGHREFDRP